jgi:tetratricopeptide (TPR) repeat protein
VVLPANASASSAEQERIWRQLSNEVLQALPAARQTNMPVEDIGADATPDAASSLRQSAHLIANSNLLVNPHETNVPARARDYREDLQRARQARIDKDSVNAFRFLISLLKSPAPDDVHRSALLELALAAQQDGQIAKAQQIFSQFLKVYSQDPSVPEVLLRQGLLYRQMGATQMALTKFYAVMTSALHLKADRLEYYQRLVLQAQAEIADTYYLQGKYTDAIDFLQRLLRMDNPALNKAQIHFKLVRAFHLLERPAETAAQAQEFLSRYPAAADQAEIRFLLALSLKQLGRNQEAMQQVLKLLQTQQVTAQQNPDSWRRWQQRTGNEIANQLYKEGDFTQALEIYLGLAQIDPTPAWQLPVWYQIGLVYERLESPAKAITTYDQILARQEEVATNGSPSLKALLDMAKWRRDYLGWRQQAHLTKDQLAADPSALKLASPTP